MRKTQQEKEKSRTDIIASLDYTTSGFLRRGKVKSAKGRENYVKASDAFRKWARDSQLVDASSLSVVDADPLLEKFAEKTFMDNDGVSAARTAIYGEAWRKG